MTLKIENFDFKNQNFDFFWPNKIQNLTQKIQNFDKNWKTIKTIRSFRLLEIIMNKTIINYNREYWLHYLKKRKFWEEFAEVRFEVWRADADAEGK